MGDYEFSHLEWPYNRKEKPFRFRAVEPKKYEPAAHAELFKGIVIDVIGPEEPPVDKYSKSRPQTRSDIDLLTFPEAFVPADSLIATLDAVRNVEPTGCFHVGLRPSAGNNHLFTTEQARSLVTDLFKLSDAAAVDLKVFQAWLEKISQDAMINIACLFLVDANGELRTCLHPKVVQSRFERSPAPEENMTEARLLTLVTLRPTDKRYTTINLQPMICSDATSAKPNSVEGNPIAVLNDHPNVLDGEIPDNIDVVSVVACTPQQTGETRMGAPYRQWHERFSEVFTRAQEETRHHYAAFVLANFQELEHGGAAGVSGLFLPVPPPSQMLPEGLALSCHGRSKKPTGSRNEWFVPDTDDDLKLHESRGFTAGLAAWDGQGEEVRVFQGTISRLPRENSLWETPHGLVDCKIRVGKRSAGGQLKFEWRGSGV